MKIRLVITAVIAKTVTKVCRLFGRGGTSLPGKTALLIYPQILSELTSGLKLIMVTGTNGKTTTTRVIGQILNENGIGYITNKSGANLVSGIASAFLEAMSCTGKYNVKTAVIEVDEAAFKTAAEYMKPDILVVTNFFRDQLDRYGELHTTLKTIAKGIGKTKNTRLILNADDSLCASLGNGSGHEASYYGFSPNAINNKDIDNYDAAYCVYCKGKYEYAYRTYGHLGGFTCPECGYTRPVSDITCSKVALLERDYTAIEFKMKDHADTFCATVNLPGLYNIYNALAGVACGQALGFPIENTIRALARLECAFGRMETIEVSGRKIKLVLVKNPSGLNQVLNSLLSEREGTRLAFAINDRAADGIDVSWLWDVKFEMIKDMQERIDCIYTSGTRRYDMAVRLKYAGITTDKIVSVRNYSELIQKGLSRMEKGHVLYVLSTYTAMQDIRKVMKKVFGLKEFWE